MKTNKPFCPLILVAGMLLAPALSQAALLGLSPNEPTVDFGGAGIIDYDAATGTVTISGVPATLFQSDPFLYGEVMGTGVDDEKLFTVQFKVDSSGQLLSGVDGSDLVIKGSVDVDFDGVPDYDGVLLEAEVAQFGFEDGGSADDSFDLRLNSVGGALAPLYSGRDLAIRVVSEISAEFPNAFNGSFAADFTGQAKGVLGAVDPMAAPACRLDLSASCSVGGGPNQSKCRIKVTKSPKHWEHEDYEYKGETRHRSTYGMHGDPMPLWSHKYATTDVSFNYVITNTGTTPVTDLLVTDSFDMPVGGVPVSMAPGESITLTRTEALGEAFDDNVTVVGHYLTSSCGDNAVVVVKDKLREKQRHDDDDFKDKGNKDHH